MDRTIQQELFERIEDPQKVKKIKLGKIKYAAQNSILESLTEESKQKVIDLLKNKRFSEMRITGE